MCSKKWAKPVRPGSYSSRAPVRTIVQKATKATSAHRNQDDLQAIVERFDVGSGKGNIWASASWAAAGHSQQQSDQKQGSATFLQWDLLGPILDSGTKGVTGG